MRRAASLAAGMLALAIASSALPACGRHEATASADTQPAPFTVKDDSQGLLLTWVDDKGDFHVETTVAAVPMTGRDTVRVVDSSHDDGAHPDSFYVVDLRAARPDGTYPIRSMTRAAFEALAVARREKTGPTLASAGPAAPANPTAPGSPSTATTADDPARPSARPPVVIYGAEWCGACHDAAKYMRAKRIPYVEKDVEKDPAAAREMQEKLAKNGLRGGSIPVIDVRGRIMVGFNAQEIEGALGSAL